jgi:hypothetical protein
MGALGEAEVRAYCSASPPRPMPMPAPLAEYLRGERGGR